jgi:hypothetical protein
LKEHQLGVGGSHLVGNVTQILTVHQVHEDNVLGADQVRDTVPAILELLLTPEERLQEGNIDGFLVQLILFVRLLRGHQVVVAYVQDRASAVLDQVSHILDVRLLVRFFYRIMAERETFDLNILDFELNRLEGLIRYGVNAISHTMKTTESVHDIGCLLRANQYDIGVRFHMLNDEVGIEMVDVSVGGEDDIYIVKGRQRVGHLMDDVIRDRLPFQKPTGSQNIKHDLLICHLYEKSFTDSVRDFDLWWTFRRSYGRSGLGSCRVDTHEHTYENEQKETFHDDLPGSDLHTDGCSDYCSEPGCGNSFHLLPRKGYNS